jgi:pimeloyl-ACP methyl ester carboxylesterase
MGAPFSRRRLLGAAASLTAIGSVAEASESLAGPAAARRTRHPVHFVFVHGAFHGAWCWYKVTAALAAAGHRTTAVELPSGGIDGTPAATVTLEAQAARVLEVLDAAEAPVVLVGHSAGGPVVSTVAEARPEKIAKLVYLTAFLLPTGASIATAVAGDPDSLITPNLVVSPDGTVFLRPESIRDVFYGACGDADVALTSTVLKPIGLQTTITPVAVGAAFESVRRFYVGCRRDHAITFGFQQTMQETLPCERSFTINSDHSPFLSRPAALVRILGAIARA